MNNINTLTQASIALKFGKTTSVELTQKCIQRIESIDENIGCYLYVDKIGAMQQAIDSDARRKFNQSLGELDGIPIGIKDMISCKGLPLNASSKILQDYLASYDATVIRNLRSKGAVIIGKLNQDEFGMGSSGENSAYKICKNPVNLSRTPGGSSSGSAAAMAANLAFGTLGTDTGGSVRQPAAFTGTVGIKPTYGRVSRFGVIAFASSLDQVGVFGHKVEDAATLLSGIAGYDEQDSTSVKISVPNYNLTLNRDIKGVRIGIPKEYLNKDVALDPEVKTCVENAISRLRTLGAKVYFISLPHVHLSVAAYQIISTAEASSNLARYDGIRYGPRIGFEGGFKNLYKETRGKLFGAEVKRRILLGTFVLSASCYDSYYIKAQKIRSLIVDDFRNAFTLVDAIICPTVPSVAYPLGERINDPLKMYLGDIFTIPANLAGLPGISIPGGFSKENLPIGIQLIGRPFEESNILNIAHMLEKILKINNEPVK